MNCKRCGKPITEQTSALYARRCVPCFAQLPIQRLRWFFTEALPIIVVILLAVLLAPAFIVYAFLRRLWHRFAPVPYRQSEIVCLMTPYFGVNGATEYVNGLRRGFFEKRRALICGTYVAPYKYRAMIPFDFYTIGREDGNWLRRAPGQLQRILDHRCSAPYQTKVSHLIEDLIKDQIKRRRRLEKCRRKGGANKRMPRQPTRGRTEFRRVWTREALIVKKRDRLATR